MKKKSNYINKLKKDKNKLLFISIILFLLLTLVLKVLPKDISEVLIYILFPLSFLVLTLVHIKTKKINWDFPIILTLFYLV